MASPTAWKPAWNRAEAARKTALRGWGRYPGPGPAPSRAPGQAWSSGAATSAPGGAGGQQPWRGRGRTAAPTGHWQAAETARGYRGLVGREGCVYGRGRGGTPGLIHSEVLGFTEAKPLPDRKASGAPQRPGAPALTAPRAPPAWPLPPGANLSPLPGGSRTTPADFVSLSAHNRQPAKGQPNRAARHPPHQAKPGSPQPAQPGPAVPAACRRPPRPAAPRRAPRSHRLAASRRQPIRMQLSGSPLYF